MKILGFLVRLILIVLLIVWLADKPGDAQIVWHDMVLQTSAAILFVIVAALIYGALLLYRLWRFFWDTPRLWKLRRQINRLEEGQGEVTKGLVAIAASDAGNAGLHARRAYKLLGKTPTVRLLQAQAAGLAGDQTVAKTLYTEMSQDSDTAVLGYRGLIMMALRSGDIDQASHLAAQLEKKKDDVPWLYALRFRISTRTENWSLAALALEKARKSHIIPKKEANQYEAALLLARAKEALRASEGKKALVMAEKARRLMPEWMPATLLLVEAQIVTEHYRMALRTIKKSWRKKPHPQLVPLVHWALHINKPIEGFKRIQKIVRTTKDNPVSLMALADAALRADLWGEARKSLLMLVSRGEATHLTYQMLARLERHETGDERAASSWLARAVAAPSDPVWLCAACGSAHEYWEASCTACGAFDKMVWGTTGKVRQENPRTLPLSFMDEIA